MGEIIAICNQKGGVGKTTTAVNLSACLAVAEKKTLLIDLDPQGNASSGLGIDKRKINVGVYDVLCKGLSPNEAIVSTHIDYLKLLPSTEDLVGATVEVFKIVSRETILKSALKSINSSFDYVIIDCPPSLGILTVNALTAADSVLIPVQCEYYAMEGLVDLSETISRIRAGLNPGLKIKGVVLTMFDSRTTLSSMVADEIRGFFNEEVFHVAIPRNVRLAEAPSFGKPIILYDVKSRGAEAYLELAREVLALEKQDLAVGVGQRTENLKSEARNSKFETNPNVPNSNDQNGRCCLEH